MSRATSPVVVCVLAVLLALAGCNAIAPGNQTPSSDSGDGPSVGTPLEPSDADTDREREFLREAQASNLTITEVETEDGTFRVRYVTEESAASLASNSDRLALAYSRVVNDTWNGNATWDASQLEAVAVNQSGTPAARFRMPAYWSVQFLQGDLTSDQLAFRLDSSFEPATRDGQFLSDSENTTQFSRGLETIPNATFTGPEERGSTVYLTATVDADSQAAVEGSMGRVASVYAAFTKRGWNTTALEATVRDTDGELHGWYHVTPELAVEFSNGSVAADAFLANSFVAEEDRLEPAN